MISIIVPVYNCEKYLPRCIESLTGQSYDDIEIILIDDGAKDSSGKICDEYAAKDKRIKVFHIENNGASHARNVGLEKAGGEWIGFCDSDDTADADMFKTLIEGAEKNNAGSAVCGYRICDSSLNPTLPDTAEAVFTQTPQQAMASVFFDKYYETHQGYIWNRIFRREILDKNGIRFDESVVFSEDKIFICEYLDNSGSVFCNTKPFYNYRSNPAGLTKSGQFVDGGRDEVYVYNHLMESLKNKDDELVRIMTGWNVHNCIVRLYYLVAARSKDKELKKLFSDQFVNVKRLSRFPEFIKPKQKIFAALFRLFCR